MKKTDLAWLAGFFDGEGCIYINHPTKVNYNLVVQVANTDKLSLEWFLLTFGGSIRKSGSAREGWKQLWQWGVSARKAEAALKTLLPYLRLKKPQAELALEFQRVRSYKRGVDAVSEAELILRESYQKNLRALK